MAETIRVRGIVQGVGFRPFIWRLALAHGLRGEVLNDAEGVLIRAAGDDLDGFCAAIREEAPPLARIDAVERASCAEPATGGFAIIATEAGAAATFISPDAATCPACVAEIFDPDARRFGHPFANCTHCGPRYSIVASIPYDRANTAMAGFGMCAACRAEYDDPADRRFHAQPIACSECGPRLDMSVDAAAERLRAGEILALKGIGGFHLLCDATHETAGARLRARKNRPAKPFALMGTEAMIRRFAAPSAAEWALLRDPAAPVVLLKKAGADLAASVAPGRRRLGWMLPYTPLHHLLLAAFGGPVVATSGNLSGAPQIIDNGAARRDLAGIADGVMAHDRPILRRLDDSVARVAAGGPVLLRRARGYAPASLSLPRALRDAPQVLAAGGDLKAALCLARDGAALLSQHLGDLEHPAALDAYAQAARDMTALFGAEPAAVACDLHPGFQSTRFAEAQGLPVIRVQHHHAHIAAALAEHGETGPAIGIALDGTGWGPDETIWGGEIMLADLRGFERLAHLAPVTLQGGDAAAREPWRCLAAHLGAEAAPLLTGRPLEALLRATAAGVNTAETSSAGRLFDAAACALGLAPDRQSFEGEAAMAVEDAAIDGQGQPYPFGDDPALIDPAPMWRALLAERARPSDAAFRFQTGLADAFAWRARHAAQARGIGVVALGGGVMQNAALLERLCAGLEGLRVLVPRMAPANDGGLALGQAAVAQARLLESG